MGAEQSAPAVEQPAQGNGRAESAATVPSKPISPKALVIVGPSGVGKGTLINKLTENSDQFGFSVSHTTRQPRTGEKHGEHYFFTTKEQFAKEIAEGRFLEYAEVHGNLYGTSVAAVRRVLEQGRVCILDIDVQGARAVRKSQLEAIFVFVAPPSLEDLARRLVGRGTETVQQIQRRLNNAKSEINSLNEKGLYDYLIINEVLDEAVVKLRHIAARAAAGQDPEPGQVPESVIIEDAPVPDLELPVPPEPSPATPTLTSNAVPPATLGAPSNGNSQAASTGSPMTSAVAASSTQESVANDGSLGGATEANQPGGMERWAGRVALVTGASSGIGWATCEALANAGLRVVAVARRKERLETLQSHMMRLGVTPSHFLPVVCDITKEAEVATLPRIVAKRWPEAGGVDVLVNNAGLSRSDASLMDGNVASWVEMLSTNVLGTAMTTRAVVQDMRRRGQWGHIINMVGLSGHRIPDGPQGGGFYCATKSAVKTITEGLRQEARGGALPLRVSAISPGIVETEFFTVRHGGDVEAAKRATSAFPCLQPTDVARAVLWVLAAPEHMEVNDIIVRPTAQLI